MRARIRARLAGGLTVLAGAGISAFVYSRYRRDIRRARERIGAGSRIAETTRGPIEYAVAGEGTPVLVVHGAGGGFDQGMNVSAPLAASGFRVVAVSRFGYLRTPLPEDASAAAQADAHAALLDELGIERSAVIGASAGAPSAMQFAIRHPERTTSLVLLVPLAYPARAARTSRGAVPRRLTAASALALNAALRSDFLFWLMLTVARRATARAILATPASVLERATSEERARAGEVAARVLPVSRRRLGLLNDAAVTESLERYELERISAPTLVVSMEDDLFGTYEGARYTADHVENALFIGYPSGGHLWVGHQADVMSAVAGFLRQHA